MKSNTLVTQNETFTEYTKSNFNELKKRIENRCKKEKYTFDEDMFMDTVVKCLTNCPKNKTSKVDIENYFWKAFKQNLLSKLSRDKYRDLIDFDDCDDDIIDEEYNEDIDKINEILKNAIITEFSQEIYDAWLLHVCNNYKYTELENNGYKGINFHNEFRQIKRYVDKMIKNNSTLKRLLYENDLI